MIKISQMSYISVTYDKIEKNYDKIKDIVVKYLSKIQDIVKKRSKIY